MLDEPLNTTIDEVARQMTDGTPGDGVAFRRRVIARIESIDSPRRTWRASFVLTAIAAAAAIIVALFIARERRPGPSGPGGMAGTVAQTPQPLPAPDAAGPNRLRQGYGGLAEAPAKAEGPATQMTAHAAPDPVVRRPRASGPGVVKTTPALEPNVVASIAVAPLAVDTLTPESIRIEQLETVASILVAPLDLTDVPRRNE